MQLYREVTQKVKKKNSSAWHVYLWRLVNGFEVLNIPAISHLLRQDYAAEVSAEFCTLRFNKKLSTTRQIIELPFGGLSVVLSCVGRAAETHVSFVKIM